MKVRIPYKSLTFQVVAGMVLGIMVGAFLPEVASAVKILSDIFIRLITLLVGPVVFCTIVSAISSHGDIKKAGKIALTAFIYFEIITTFALVLGLFACNVLKPGVGIDTAQADVSQIAQYLDGARALSAYDHIVNIFPKSFIDAFAKNNLLQILFFSIIFGISMAIAGKRVEPLKNMTGQFGEVIFTLLHFIVRLAPLAAFGAMAYTVSKFGVQILLSFSELIFSIYMTMIFFVVVVLGSICYFFGFNLWSLLKFIKTEAAIVFATSSSEAVLPQLMEKLEKFGCNKEVVSIVVPTGYSFNLDGTSIYLSAAVIFIAQAFSIDLSLMQEIAIIAVLMLNSKGTAAVAGGGFVTLTATLIATNILPVEGLVLLLGVDGFMSRARALTNVIGNSVATVVISRWEERKQLKIGRSSGNLPGQS